MDEPAPESDRSFEVMSVPEDTTVRRFGLSFCFLSFADVPKYQDPLHILLSHVTEVCIIVGAIVCAHLAKNAIVQQGPNSDITLIHDDNLRFIDVVTLLIYPSLFLSHSCSRWQHYSLMN
jgi:hypothetical protein